MSTVLNSTKVGSFHSHNSRPVSAMTAEMTRWSYLGGKRKDTFTRTYVSAVENGHVVPSLVGLILPSRQLGVTLGAILDSAMSAIPPDPGKPQLRPGWLRARAREGS